MVFKKVSFFPTFIDTTWLKIDGFFPARASVSLVISNRM